MRRWSAMADLPENASKVKSVDESCKALKKETDAEISSSAEKRLQLKRKTLIAIKPKRLKKMEVFKLRSIMCSMGYHHLT